AKVRYDGGSTGGGGSTQTTPAPTMNFSASPTAITSGQSSILSWSSTNASSCAASNGWAGTKSTSGTQTLSPTATSTYKLTCTGSGGSVAESVTVNVRAATTSTNTSIPTVVLIASPTSIALGASATLNWS